MSRFIWWICASKLVIQKDKETCKIQGVSETLLEFYESLREENKIGTELSLCTTVSPPLSLSTEKLRHCHFHGDDVSVLDVIRCH